MVKMLQATSRPRIPPTGDEEGPWLRDSGLEFRVGLSSYKQLYLLQSTQPLKPLPQSPALSTAHWGPSLPPLLPILCHPPTVHDPARKEHDPSHVQCRHQTPSPHVTAQRDCPPSSGRHRTPGNLTNMDLGDLDMANLGRRELCSAQSLPSPGLSRDLGSNLGPLPARCAHPQAKDPLLDSSWSLSGSRPTDLHVLANPGSHGSPGLPVTGFPLSASPISPETAPTLPWFWAPSPAQEKRNQNPGVAHCPHRPPSSVAPGPH